MHTAVFPKEAPMQMVLESGLPQGAQAAEFGLVIPFPEQDFFDEDALSMTIEQGEGKQAQMQPPG